MSKLREISDGNYKPTKELSKVRRVTASQVFAEAKGAGIDPKEFADKINAAFDEQEANGNKNYSVKCGSDSLILRKRGSLFFKRFRKRGAYI